MLRLLNFARILTKTPVIKGESSASIATGFFDAQSLDETEAAIADGCDEMIGVAGSKFVLDMNVIIALQRFCRSG